MSRTHSLYINCSFVLNAKNRVIFIYLFHMINVNILFTNRQNIHGSEWKEENVEK